MKRTIFKNLLILSISALSASAFAASVVVTETSSWRPVPITVDTTANTYTVTGPVPTDTTDFYYTYSGYRCFKSKREVGLDAVIFKASVEGSPEIYCYPE